MLCISALEAQNRCPRQRKGTHIKHKRQSHIIYTQGSSTGVLRRHRLANRSHRPPHACQILRRREGIRPSQRGGNSTDRNWQGTSNSHHCRTGLLMSYHRERNGPFLYKSLCSGTPTRRNPFGIRVLKAEFTTYSIEKE
jgi:hypothetical protein